jgi:hypothetical protein
VLIVADHVAVAEHVYGDDVTDGDVVEGILDDLFIVVDAVI